MHTSYGTMVHVCQRKILARLLNLFVQGNFVSLPLHKYNKIKNIVLWDFVNFSHCGIMSCEILSSGIMSRFHSQSNFINSKKGKYI